MFRLRTTKVLVIAASYVLVALSVNGLAMLVLGIFPASLLSVCQAAFS